MCDILEYLCYYETLRKEKLKMTFGAIIFITFVGFIFGSAITSLIYHIKQDDLNPYFIGLCILIAFTTFILLIDLVDVI
jgi:hypothetical protein